MHAVQHILCGVKSRIMKKVHSNNCADYSKMVTTTVAHGRAWGTVSNLPIKFPCTVIIIISRMHNIRSYTANRRAFQFLNKCSIIKSKTMYRYCFNIYFILLFCNKYDPNSYTFPTVIGYLRLNTCARHEYHN